MALVGIDLFAGAGGMSLGAISAGIEVALAVEIDCHATETYAFNLPAAPLFLGDVRSLNSSHLRAVKRGRQGTVLFGGSPCQGFSSSNQRTRNRQNGSNWLYLEFVRVAKIWNPDWLVFENVQGMRETEQGLFFRDLLQQLSDLRYDLAHGVLDAANFGVPQHRKRLFVIGSRCGFSPVLPQPNPNCISVDAAISDLPLLLNGASANWMAYQSSPRSDYSRVLRGSLRRSSNHLVTRNAEHVLERYRYISQGGNWTNIPGVLMRRYPRSRRDLHTGLYHRLRPDQPSLVIGNYRKNLLIHPHQNRGLSVREAARIQSFPDWFEFRGSIGFQQQQVGNAVPPYLAREVFRTILSLSGLSSAN